MLDEDARRKLDRDFVRLAEGDRDAIAEVFTVLRPILVSYCRRLLRGVEADGEDAAHAALEKIFSRAADYDPTRSALAWALTFATWECRTLATRRRRSREAPIEHAEGARDESASPETRATLDELYGAALEAMGTLTAGDREVLREAFWSEEKGPQSAASRKRKERAVGRLREAWRKLYGW